MMGNKKWNLLGQLILIIFVALLPLFNDSRYLLTTLLTVGIYSIVTIGLCLLMGYAGQISLGHAAFFGLGAYASGILTVTYHWNPWLAMGAGAVLTGAVAYLIGIPSLKLKEHYLALATLGFGIIINMIYNQESAITGGPSGFSGVPRLAIGDLVFNTDLKFYYLTWAFVVVAIFLAHNLVDSRVGRALKAIHSSEVAAESMGIDTAAYKLRIFVISAVFASVAGSLYVHYITFVSPDTFTFKMSVEFVTMAVVGGLASVWGPVFGVAGLTFLSEFLRDFVPMIIPQAGGEFEIVFFGLILVAMMIFMPEGIFPGLANLLKKFQKKGGISS